MRYTLLLALVTFATFAAACTAIAAGIALSWSHIAPGLARVAPAARARLLFSIRVAPAATGVIAAIVAALAFVRYEPHSTTEVPGLLLISMTTLGAALVLVAVSRLASGCWSTLRFVTLIERTAIPTTLGGVALPTFQVETPFPLVAVAGLFRPRLLIARRVFEEVPADELQVVIRHELAHATRRDNLVRLLVSGMPDVLSCSSRRVAIERAWCDAAEEAADDLATGHDVPARLRLASALVRIARMAERHSLPGVPLLAFHSGESVERRVRRLVDAPSPVCCNVVPLGRVAVLAILVSALPFLASSAALLPAMHRAIEWLVNARI